MGIIKFTGKTSSLEGCKDKTNDLSKEHGDNVVSSTSVDTITQGPPANDLHHRKEVNTTRLLATQSIANDYEIMDNTYTRKM